MSDGPNNSTSVQVNSQYYKANVPAVDPSLSINVMLSIAGVAKMLQDRIFSLK